MNHRDFGAQRFSPLDVINRSNVRNLKLAFAIALGGTSKDEYLQMTPLVEDGFMYVVDSWGIVSKVDVRSGTSGPIIWQMNPKLEKQDRNRGVALWNNLVISQTGFAARVIATDKDTGKVVWETNLLDQQDLELTAAPLALKDQIVVGASGGDRGIRPWIASLDAHTGKPQWKFHSVPAPHRGDGRARPRASG
jgi:alcohol dehydrogenase (cytochrome c)